MNGWKMTEWMNECWKKPQKCTCMSNVLAFFSFFQAWEDPHTHTICYGQDEMACHLHPIIYAWDAVTTCTSVTIFFPLGVQLHSLKIKTSVTQPNTQKTAFWTIPSHMRQIISTPKIM